MMTNVGMFEDAEKIAKLEKENKNLKKKLLNYQRIDLSHKEWNSQLHQKLEKLEKTHAELIKSQEVKRREWLEKENTILKDKDLLRDEIQALNLEIDNIKKTPAAAAELKKINN
jgi:hypothetical protein